MEATHVPAAGDRQLVFVLFLEKQSSFPSVNIAWPNPSEITFTATGTQTDVGKALLPPAQKELFKTFIFDAIEPQHNLMVTPKHLWNFTSTPKLSQLLSLTPWKAQKLASANLPYSDHECEK